MSKNGPDKDALAKLLLDVLSEDSRPELLAAHATDAKSLSPEERARVQTLLADSPQAADQLRILQGFDPREIAKSEPEPSGATGAGSSGSIFQSILGFRLSGPVLGSLAVGAAAVALAVYVIPGKPTDPFSGFPDSAEMVARAPERGSPSVAPSAKAPPPTRMARPPTRPAVPGGVEARDRVLPPASEPFSSQLARAENATPESAEPTAPGPSESDSSKWILVANAIDYRAPAGAALRGSAPPVLRGIGTQSADKPLVRALAPVHVGHTASLAPSVLWYLADAPDDQWTFRFQLDRAGLDAPVVDVTLPHRPTRAGIQRLRLFDVGVQLEAHREYNWSITVQRDVDGATPDVVAEGWIERRDLSNPERTRLGGDLIGNAAVFAEAGFWYDALSAVADEVENHGDSEVARAAYRRLLSSIGLDELGEHPLR